MSAAEILGAVVTLGCVVGVSSSVALTFVVGRLARQRDEAEAHACAMATLVDVLHADAMARAEERDEARLALEERRQT